MSNFKFSGSIVALVTPMTSSGDVDFDSLDTLVDYHLQNNTDGIVALGTTGESVTLENNEKEAIVKRILARVNGRIPVIVGTGSNCTRTTIQQSKNAEKWGADALLVVTPYYNKPSQQGLIAHYKAVASQVDIPIILYNVPGRTACDMQPETTAILAAEENIIAIKEASADPERIKQLVKLCPRDFILLSGDDETIIDFLRAGGHGIISVTSNIVPNKIHEICQAASQHNWQLAESINEPLHELHKNLFISSNPVPVKWALYHIGLTGSGQCRLPLLPLEQKHHSKLVSALEHAGLDKLANAG